MSQTLHCDNCGEDLGKASENDEQAYCGNCGHTTDNPQEEPQVTSGTIPNSRYLWR